MSPALSPFPTGPIGTATSQSDLIADALKRAILSGQLTSDQVLVERHLASEMGVSKTPVREALIQLTASGLVTTLRNRGSVVRRMSAQDAQHVYEQRQLLEPWAFAASISSGGMELTEATKSLEESKRRSEESDWPRAVMANRSFHRSLYQACPNPLVVESLDKLQDLTALATVAIVWGSSKMTQREHRDHSRLLELAQAGCAEEGEELMRDHVGRALEWLMTADS